MRLLTLLLVVLMVSACFAWPFVDILEDQSADADVVFVGNLTEVQLTPIGAEVDFAVGIWSTNRLGTVTYKQLYPGDASPDSLLKAPDGYPFGVEFTGKIDSVHIRVQPVAEVDIVVIGK